MRQLISRIAITIAGITGFILSIAFFINETDSISSLFPSLSARHVDALLLLIISSVLLFTVLDRYSSLKSIDDDIAKLDSTIIGDVKFGKNKIYRNYLIKKMAAYISKVLLIIIITQTIYIAVIDLIGGFSGSIKNEAEMILLIKKLSLFIFGITFVGNNIISRREQIFSINKKIQNIILNIIKMRSKMEIQLIKRANFEKFWMQYLKELNPSSEIYLTHFEEPKTMMKSNGYYYGKDFMEKWYQIIDKKNAEVNLVILLNQPRDFEDLLTRLKRVSSMGRFYIYAIVAPPLTLYFDFLVAPSQFAFLATSDEPSNPNLNTISILTKNAQLVDMLYKMFIPNILGKAVPIKTREGVNDENLNSVKDELEKIAKAKFRRLRNVFRIDK